MNYVENDFDHDEEALVEWGRGRRPRRVPLRDRVKCRVYALRYNARVMAPGVAPWLVAGALALYFIIGG